MWDPACTRRLHLPPLPAATTPQHIPACLSSSSNATAPKARPSPLGIQLAFNNSAFLELEQQQQCDTPQNNDHNPPPPPWSRQPSRDGPTPGYQGVGAGWTVNGMPARLVVRSVPLFHHAEIGLWETIPYFPWIPIIGIPEYLNQAFLLTDSVIQLLGKHRRNQK
ncbi:hypothetical protein CPC08DRAFT_760591 [Agrocybe pediades]|nr:hypothetical protein CPC08DRAFT_760591 [Agrocybe pediades]